MSLASKLDSLTPQERTQLALRLSLAKRQAASKKDTGLPSVQPDERNRFKPFPLTDLQQAYLIGRSEGIELGNISCHGYAEVDMEDWDRERFQFALQKMIDRHEMLRCIVLPEGRQQILSSPQKYEIKVNDLRKLDAAATAARLESIRARMSHQVHASDQWPLFEFCVSLLDSKISRLHISTDLLIGDGRSFEIVFQELMQLYQNPEASLPPIDLSFRDYLQALTSLEQTDVFRESREYWTKRIPTMPPSPELPLEKNPASITRPEFKRRSASVDAAVWRNLKEKAAQFHSTPVGTLLAAYAEVLAIWSKNPHFTINLTLFNRLPLHPQANDIVGDFTSVNLLEVDNSKPASFESARMQQQQEKACGRIWIIVISAEFRVMRELSRFQRVGPTAIMPVVFTSLLNLGEQGDEDQPGLAVSGKLRLYHQRKRRRCTWIIWFEEPREACRSTGMRWRNFSPPVSGRYVRSISAIVAGSGCGRFRLAANARGKRAALDPRCANRFARRCEQYGSAPDRRFAAHSFS